MISLEDPILQKEIAELHERRTDLLARCRPEGSGLDWCIEHTQIVDDLLKVILKGLPQVVPDAPPLAIVATGGYGRRELAPFSDIDLTVVPQNEESPKLDDALRQLFKGFQQVLGGKFGYEIGYSFRLIADVPGLDPVTRTSLLDARLAAGSLPTFKRLMESVRSQLPVGDFILAKIKERRELEEQTNDSPLVVEPHLKEGRGGLRSYQCANWIRVAIGEQTVSPSDNYDCLLSARNLLHTIVGRRQDVLTVPRLIEITDRWDLDRDSFMASVTQALIEGESEFEMVLGRIHEARFSLSNSVAAIRDEARFYPGADPGEAAVGAAAAVALGMKVSDFPSTFSQNVDGPAALYAVGQGETTVRCLDRCGLLRVLLPELTDCRTLMPGDASHVFTVFEHTMRVVRALDQAKNDPLMGDLSGSVSDSAPLYLAALLHDTGKQLSASTGREHSETGAEIAANVCERWGLSDSVFETVVWLVREHLAMSRFMRLRDLENPSTIADFAALVKTPERLVMLALLTWADISAVGPGTFTSGQEVFLKQLVSRTFDVLEGDEEVVRDARQAKRAIIKGLAPDSSKLEEFLLVLPAHYLTGNSPTEVEHHMAMVTEASEEGPLVEAVPLPSQGATKVTICAADRSGLLSQILGVFYAFDLSIGSIKAFTTSTESPMAIDIFTVSFSGRPVPQGTWKHVLASLMQVLRQTMSADEILVKRGKDPTRRQKLLRLRFMPGDPAILELQTPRGRGMPYRLSRSLKEQGFNILAARVGQWAGTAAAAFYVRSAIPDVTVAELVEKAFPSEANAYM